MSFHVTGIERNRSLEFVFCSRPIPFEVSLHHTESGVRLRQRFVQLDGSQGGSFRLWICVVWRLGVVVPEDVVGIGDARIALRIGGIEADRLLETGQRFPDAVFRSLTPEITSLEIQLVRFRIDLSRLAKACLLFR